MAEPFSIQPIKKSNHDRERVYVQLRDAILSGNIKPFERIVETTYAEKFQISRTPIREALRMLERDGLVEYQPRKGAIARGLMSEEEMDEVYDVRAMLQTYSIDGSLKNITEAELDEMKFCNDECLAALETDDIHRFFRYHDRFNLLLVESSRMKVVYKLLMQIENYNPITSFAGAGDSGTSRIREAAVPGPRQHAAVSEHIAIYEALRARDREACHKALAVHLENCKVACVESMDRLRAQLESGKDDDE